MGVLAFGSLLTDPGAELAAATARRQPHVRTPFRVEFARSSSVRGGAPTLVPVTTAGAHVNGTVLVLHDWVSVEDARDRLYRREIHQVGSGKTYPPWDEIGVTAVQIGAITEFEGIATVLYAALPETIPPAERTGERLADLAIASVARAEKDRDGITYLANVLTEGIITPLAREYEAAILRRTGTSTLWDALDAVTSRR